MVCCSDGRGNKGRDPAASESPSRQGKASDGQERLKELGASRDSVSGRSCPPFWRSLSGLAVPQGRGLHHPPFSGAASSLKPHDFPTFQVFVAGACCPQISPRCTVPDRPSRTFQGGRNQLLCVWGVCVCVDGWRGRGSRYACSPRNSPSSLPKPGTILRRQCPAMGSTLRTKTH